MEGKKVIVVEDDTLLKDMLGKQLTKEGWQVLHATEGEQAISFIESEKPDVILLDLLLPGTGGFDVLDTIKKKDATKDIPVIILSNLGQQEDIDRGLKMGAVDFLVKSNFTLDEVSQKIKDTVGAQ
jgi:DNA-binding response OmpR family regulator